jgi:hypothetical protein
MLPSALCTICVTSVTAKTRFRDDRSPLVVLRWKMRTPPEPPTKTASLFVLTTTLVAPLSGVLWI